MVGTWWHGNKHFTIHELQGGSLRFEDPAHSGGLSGILSLQSSDVGYEAELIQMNGEIFGVMRFFLCEKGGQPILNFTCRKAGMDTWGKGRSASKASSPAVSMHTSSSSSNDSSVFQGRPLIDPAHWECQHCTLINDSDVLHCSACNYERHSQPNGHHSPSEDDSSARTSSRSQAASAVRRCPVCFEEEEVDVALTPCGHLFCADCADRAVSIGRCHLCRVCPSSTQKVFF